MVETIGPMFEMQIIKIKSLQFSERHRSNVTL